MSLARKRKAEKDYQRAQAEVTECCQKLQQLERVRDKSHFELRRAAEDAENPFFCAVEEVLGAQELVRIVLAFSIITYCGYCKELGVLEACIDCQSSGSECLDYITCGPWSLEYEEEEDHGEEKTRVYKGEVRARVEEEEDKILCRSLARRFGHFTDLDERVPKLSFFWNGPRESRLPAGTRLTIEFHIPRGCADSDDEDSDDGEWSLTIKPTLPKNIFAHMKFTFS